MSVRLHRVLPPVLLAGTVLISGCAGSDSEPKADGQAASSTPAARPSPATVLPDGIVKLGTPVPVGDGAWTVTLQGFERQPAGAVPGVPAARARTRRG